MKNSKPDNLRELRQAEKIAQRKSDAVAIKQGIDPSVIQQNNSIFEEGLFANAPIKRNGRVVAR